MDIKRLFHVNTILWLCGQIIAQPPPPCSACPDGSEPLVTTDLLDESRFGPDVSCETLVSDAQNLDVDTDECNSLQLSALQGGCCSSSLGSRCTLCPDGLEDLAFPLRLLPSPFEGASDVSCINILRNESIETEFLIDFEGEAGVCNNTRLRRSAGYCGCPKVAGVCELCSEGALLPDQVFSLTKSVCSDIAYEFSLLPFGQCSQSNADSNSMAGFDAAAFCCSDVPKPDQCNLCSVREELVDVRAVTTASYGEVTCADLQEAASYASTNSACRALQQESGGFCCVELSNVNPCELICPDGSLPPDPFKKDPLTGHSCQSLALEFAKFSDDECGEAAVAVGFDAVAFCCPGVEPQDKCAICSVDEELLYPERVLFSFEEQSCASLSSAVSYLLGDACQRILDDSRAKRNCQCRPNILPTPPPAGVPNRANGGGSGAFSLGSWQSFQISLLGTSLLFWIIL